MSLALYMDVHVPGPISRALIARGVDVLTAQKDGTERVEDPELLDRATLLNRVLFTRDDDLLVEARLRQEKGQVFAGVIYGHQLRVSISACIKDLEIIAKVGEPDDLRNRVEHLPLR